MENPHAERQNIILQRILKNADKCTETIVELNHCLEEISVANSHVKIAAELVIKYRKNVQYNLEATAATNLEATAATNLEATVAANHKT